MTKLVVPRLQHVFCERTEKRSYLQKEKNHEYKEKITLMREKKESLALVCSYFKHLLLVAMEIIRHDGASLARCHTKANGVENSILKNLGSRVIKSNQVKEMERFLYKIGVDGDKGWREEDFTKTLCYAD